MKENSQIRSVIFDILLSPLDGESPNASPDERENAANIRRIAESWDGSNPPPPEVEALIGIAGLNPSYFKGIKNFEKEDEYVETGPSKHDILKMISEYSFALNISDVAKWASFASYIEAMTLAALVTGDPLHNAYEANNIKESASLLLRAIPRALKIYKTKPSRSLLRALNAFPGIPQNIALSMVDFLTPAERVGVLNVERAQD